MCAPATTSPLSDTERDGQVSRGSAILPASPSPAYCTLPANGAGRQERPGKRSLKAGRLRNLLGKQRSARGAPPGAGFGWRQPGGAVPRLSLRLAQHRPTEMLKWVGATESGILPLVVVKLVAELVAKGPHRTTVATC